MNFMHGQSLYLYKSHVMQNTNNQNTTGEAEYYGDEP
jgi:hypothetical protein